MEPFFSVLGMATAILGLLSATTSTVVSKKDQLLGFDSSIHACRAQAQTCVSRYSVWASSAGWNTSSMDSMQQLLGEEFKELKGMVDRFQQKAREVLDRLSLKKESEDGIFRHIPLAQFDEKVDAVGAAAFRKLLDAFRLSSSFRHPAEDPADNDLDKLEDIELGAGGYGEFWQVLIKPFVQSGGDRCRLASPKVGLVRRIRWILWRDGQLQKCLTALSGLLADLEQYSDDLLVRRGLASGGATDGFIDATTYLRFIECVKQIDTKFVISPPDIPPQQWSTLLGYDVKVDEESVRNQRVRNVELRFAVRGKEAERVKFFRVDWDTEVAVEGLPSLNDDAAMRRRLIAANTEDKYYRQNLTLPDATVKMRLSRRAEEFHSWSHSVRNILCECALDENFAFNLLHERTKIAQDLSFWVPLLWTTGLTDHLCACAIRGVVSQKSKLTKRLAARFTRATPGDHKIEYSLHSRYFETDPDPKCCPSFSRLMQAQEVDQDRDKYFDMAIVLAELFVGRPIHHRTESQILTEVCANSLDGFNIRHAVKYCFERAYESSLPTDMGFRDSSGRHLSYAERENFWKTVTKP